MAKTLSTMLDLGTEAPDFSLPDVSSGKIVSLADFAGKKALLVMFICRHCPFVKHVERELAKLGTDYVNQDVAIVAISANDATAFPDDAPESLKEMVAQLGFVFPFLYDEHQLAAKAFSAACTPDFFLFDGSRTLVYRGQLDSSRPDNGIPVTGNDLRAALDAVLNDQAVNQDQRASIGCNIKGKEGNEPNYFASALA